MDELGVGGRSGKTPRWFVVDWRADQAGGEARVALMLPLEFLFLPTSRCTQSTWSFAALRSTFEAFAVFTMVRHKKDNFSRGGKKSSHPRPRPVPRDDGDEAGGASSRPAFKAACWDMGHCDPKRCSGKRLMKLGLMRELHIGQRFPGVIVSYATSHLGSKSSTNHFTRPNAKKVISPADKELMEQHGAAVVECSWVRVKEVPWSRIGGKCERLCMCTARWRIHIY